MRSGARRAALKWPTWSYRVLLPLLSVGITLAVGEGLCRLFGWGAERPAGFRFYVRNIDGDVEETYNREDPDLMWSPAPGVHDAGLYRVSPEGFRGALPPGSGPLVACLGDSSTFGVDTPEPQTWPRVLSSRLPAGARVLNAGVTGYTVVQAAARYQRDVRALRPAVVVLYVGINDPVARFWLSDSQVLERRVPPEVAALEASWLLQLQLYRALRALVADELDGRPPVPRVAAAEFSVALEALAHQVAADGGRLIVLVPPVDPTRSHGWPRLPEIEHYKERLRRVAGARVVEPRLSPGAGFIDIVHPSPLGHRELAAALAPEVSVALGGAKGRSAE